jgi:hypothetical protein
MMSISFKNKNIIYISSRDLLVLSFSVIGYNRIVSFVYLSFVVVDL